MNATTIVMAFASIGFIVMGFVTLKSKKIKNLLADSYMYNDLEKFMAFNGTFNISIGLVGIILAILDYFLKEQSKYIIIIFIVIMVIASVVQKVISKKYKNS